MSDDDAWEMVSVDEIIQLPFSDGMYVVPSDWQFFSGNKWWTPVSYRPAPGLHGWSLHTDNIRRDGGNVRRPRKLREGEVLF